MIPAAILMMTLAVGPTVDQQLGNALCRLTVSAREIPLSGTLTLIVSIEGRAPVEVESPRPVTKSPDWRVRAAKPRVHALPEGRERWEQIFELEPFQAGSTVALPLEPISFRTGNELRDWQLRWEPLGITVTSSIPDADLGHAKTVTTIEPIPPIDGAAKRRWVIPVIFFLVLTGLAGLVALALRRSKRPGARMSPVQSALADLELLEKGSLEHLAQVADIVRRFLEAQFQYGATRQTTSEFLLAIQTSQALPSQQSHRLEDLLRRCDLAKFAGVAFTKDEGARLLAIARQFILENSPPAHSADNAKSVPIK